MGLEALSEDLLSKALLPYFDLRTLHSFLLLSQHSYHWQPRFTSLLIDFERFKLENASLLRNSSNLLPARFACHLKPTVLLLDEVLNTSTCLPLLISKQLMDQLRSMKSLTPSVSLMLDAVCELFGMKPERVKQAKGEVEVNIQTHSSSSGMG